MDLLEGFQQHPLHQFVIVRLRGTVFDETVFNTVNVNLSYDPLLLACISAGIHQDPSQESNMLKSPPGPHIPYSWRI